MDPKLDLTTVRFGPPVRTGTVVKKPNRESDFRFLNPNRNLNRSKSGSGSVLEIQNREPNRNRTKKNLNWTGPNRNRTGTDRFSQQIFKFFWPLGKRSNDHFAPNGHITVLCFKKSKKKSKIFFFTFFHPINAPYHFSF